MVGFYLSSEVNSDSDALREEAGRILLLDHHHAGATLPPAHGGHGQLEAVHHAEKLVKVPSGVQERQLQSLVGNNQGSALEWEARGVLLVNVYHPKERRHVTLL